MDAGQQKLIQPDSSPGKTDHAGVEAGIEQKMLSSVGFYKLEAPNNEEDMKDNKNPEPAGEANEEAPSDKLETDPRYLEKAEEQVPQREASPDYLEEAPQREEKTLHEEGPQSLNYFDQTLPASPQQSDNNKVLSCLCKECVENLKNKHEEVKESEVSQQRDDEFLPCEDGASIHSGGSKLSEEELRGNEDAQATLAYPDHRRPPECIARLSQSGLYDELAGKAAKQEEDKISQVVSAAFFVQHQEERPSQQKKVQMELVDIEKGEAEPLMRSIRRAAHEEPPDPRICQCNRGCLKVVGSFATSLIVFPAFLYGAYAWLPFNAPLMPDIPTRLVYTMRCASFASLPIILGVIIQGISRLCASSYDPFEPQEREVTIHRRFVKQGTFLFVLFFFNLSVLATYLPQDHLKFIPLLTCLFTLAQLIYWLSFAVSRSFRGFGYGLTFFPLIAMVISNLYFMFLVEPEKMVFLGSRNVPQH